VRCPACLVRRDGEGPRKPRSAAGIMALRPADYSLDPVVELL
jgi:hypothetical protein